MSIPSPEPRLLVVCTANICRSPMAEGLIRGRLADLGLSDRLSVESAGVFAESGRPAAPLAVDQLARRGIDLRRHRSRRADAALVAAARLVLVMEEAHRRHLFLSDPRCAAKVLLMSELSGRHEDVTDPWGGSEADYEACLQTLDSWLDTGWDRLLELLGRSAGA